MLLKEIMLRIGTRTKEANASDMGALPAFTSSVTVTRKLLNPGTLSLLLKVLTYLSDCPQVSRVARGPSIFTVACGVSGGIVQTLSCGMWLIPDGTRAPCSGRAESYPLDLRGSPRHALNSKEETQGGCVLERRDKR